LHPNKASFNKRQMPRKSITAYTGNRVWRLIVAVLTLLRYPDGWCADTNAEPQRKFLGASSCASSGCHGGGGAHQNQHLVWSTRDFHFQRPVATLTTARSKQIAAALQIKDPTADHQCISCHAPLREVPDNLRGEGFRISEGVSCETCHAPAENWLRSHTRTDYTHTDRVLSGMRDLKNLYVRANTCVACHQNISVPLLRAGHPELIFELDGQAVAEPKHWREKGEWHGAQAWAVGQAVALREAFWQLDSLEKPDEKLTARTSALAWLCEKLGAGTNGFPQFREGRANADKFARELSQLNWSAAHTDSILRALANVSGDFKKTAAFPEQHARRAERLVLALDRLLHPQHHPKADVQLKNLFALAQSIPDFDAGKFADALDDFASALKKP
jgi:hypothetical protein